MYDSRCKSTKSYLSSSTKKPHNPNNVSSSNTNVTTTNYNSYSNTNLNTKRQKQYSNKNNFLQNLINLNKSNIKKMFTDQTKYSYKPQINDLPFQIYPNNRDQVEVSKEEIFERLINNSQKKKQEHYKLLKLQKEEDQFQKKCTFKPIITEISKKIAQQKRKEEKISDINLFDRLYNEAIQKNQQKSSSSILPSYIQAQQQHLTFHPNINPNSYKILNNQKNNLEPIHLRLEQIMKQKRLKQKIIQQQKIKQSEQISNFKIQNAKTLQIINKKINQNGSVNVVRRLLDDYYKQKVQKQNKIMKDQNQKYQQLCPFRPTINSNVMNDSSLENQNFFQRQKIFQLNLKQNIQIKTNQLKPKFKPEINKISQLLTRDRQGQTLQEKVYRLNYQSLCQKQEKIEELEQSLYKECTFHPKINTISKSLDGNGKAHKCNCIRPQQIFDFKPQINKKSRSMALNPVNLLNKKTKQEVITKIKMQTQYKQLIECTFQPKTKTFNKQILKENIQNIVPGAKLFLQKSQMIKKKKIQQQNYKQKIFNLQKRYRPKSHTKVNEFKLTKKQPQVYKLKTQAEEKFIKQHPFKPNINSLKE